MAIKDIYSSIGKVGKKVAGSIADYFEPVHVIRADSMPVKRIVPKEKIPEALRYLESSGGIDPNTPRNQRRQYEIPPLNGNEQKRVVSYDSGFGGEYGITPTALATLAKSSADNNAPVSKYTKYGKPLIPGMDTKKIQQELMTREGAGRIATEYFNRRPNNSDFSPETLAQDYVDYYVGKGMINDTPQNRKRALEYFISLAQ